MIDLVAYACFFLTVALGYAIMCLGLNVQWGQTGVFNVGVAGFVAVGAYASVLLTTPPTVDRLGGFELPIGVGWLAAFLVSGALSALIGWLTIRLRSDYLAIATFGFAVTVQLAALNLESVTGGPFGVGFVPRPFGAWAREPLRFAAANLAVVAVLVIALYLVLQRLTRSPWGRVLRAIREDEAAAESLGKNPTAFRVQAFALGGAIMGLGGAVQAHFIGFIAPENYLPMLTFQVWAMLVVGGSGNHRGAIPRRGAGLGRVGAVGHADRRGGAGRPAGARRLPADRRHRHAAVPDPAAPAARADRRARCRVAARRPRRFDAGARPEHEHAMNTRHERPAPAAASRTISRSPGS